MKKAFIVLVLLHLAGCASGPANVKTTVSPSFELDRNHRVAVLPLAVTGYPGVTADDSLVDPLGILLMENGFTVIEKSRVKAVIDELKLSLSGLLPEESARDIGKLLGADILILGEARYRYVTPSDSGTGFNSFVIGNPLQVTTRKEGHYRGQSVTLRIVRSSDNGTLVEVTALENGKADLKENALEGARKILADMRK